jgi:hypothetical protein
MLGFPASVAVNSWRMGPPISGLDIAIGTPAGSVVAGAEPLKGPAHEICGAALGAAGSAKLAEARDCKKELSAAISVELPATGALLFDGGGALLFDGGGALLFDGGGALLFDGGGALLVPDPAPVADCAAVDVVGSEFEHALSSAIPVEVPAASRNCRRDLGIESAASPEPRSLRLILLTAP